VYILDPEEVEERKRSEQGSHAPKEAAAAPAIEEELRSEFPSLAASLYVPYDDNNDRDYTPAELAKQNAEELRRQALLPVSNSGKYYNSFRKYGDLLKPKEAKPKDEADQQGEEETQEVQDTLHEDAWQRDAQSRIIGGTGMSGQGTEVEDDGEGWITSTTEIRKMKAVGRLDPTVSPAVLNENQAKAQERTSNMSAYSLCNH
jgi:hypothetical protein